VQKAREWQCDVCLSDTAGRLAINDELMGELEEIKSNTKPDNIILVVDAMTGQDAVTVAEAFHETLQLDGVILSKLDGDARGGAALSVKEVTGSPIAFASTGEKMDAFELFHPDRMAGRILGMGDVLSLIEQAEEVFEKDQAEQAASRMLEGQFTFDDFLDQMRQVQKMGSLSSIIAMMPGVPKELKNVDIDDGELRRVEAIICSMTADERRQPELINGSRRLRIANGSGTTTGEVNRLVKQFQEMQKLMKRMGGLGSKKGKRRMPSLPPGFPGMN